MISGIGCDIVDLRRLDYKNIKFVCKILTDNEYSLFLKKETDKQKKEFLGGRFAVKEAFFKAYGIKHNIVSFHDVEVINDDSGKPVINFPDTFVSISHENNYAIAYVVVEEG